MSEEYINNLRWIDNTGRKSVTDFKFGVDNCFCLKRWPEPEAWMNIIKNKLGLDIIEFDSDFLDPLFVSEEAGLKIAGEIKKSAEKNNILLHNYFTGEMTHNVNLLSHPDKRIRNDSIKWVEKAIKIASNMGVRGIGGHFDTIPSDIVNEKKKYKYYLDRLVEDFVYFSELASNENHKILMLEQMYSPGEVPYTIKQTYELLEKINKRSKIKVSPVIDVGHSCCHNFDHSQEDIDPYIWLKEFGSIAEVVHLHQTTHTSSEHWPFTEKYNARGIIDADKVLEALELSGSNENYLILEIFFPFYMNDKQIIDEMIETVEYWKGYLQ